MGKASRETRFHGKPIKNQSHYIKRRELFSKKEVVENGVQVLIFHGNARKSWECKKRTFGRKGKDGEGDRDEPNDSKEDEAVTVESDGRRVGR